MRVALILTGDAARAARKIALDKAQVARVAKDKARAAKRFTASPSASHDTGNYESPTHVSWMHMRTRCSDPKSSHFSRYGGATHPVVVCKRWADPKRGFKNFLADMGERIPGTSIGRFGDTGRYTKTNCSWQAPAEQILERELRNELRNPALFARKMQQFRKNHYNLMFALSVNNAALAIAA